MAEHWPAALMLWSLGAAVGVVLLRQWPQVRVARRAGAGLAVGRVDRRAAAARGVAWH